MESDLDIHSYTRFRIDLSADIDTQYRIREILIRPRIDSIAGISLTKGKRVS